MWLAGLDMINVAIIGAGIGREHLRAYQALADRYSVRALCDIDAARGREVLAAEGSKAQLVSDLETVLGDPVIDLIDVCLPPHLHYEVSLQALAAGKHVVCEKPLVSSLREADALADAAARYGRVLTPVFQYRYGPEVAKLKALIGAGFTGRAFLASIETHWHRSAAYYDNPWRGTWAGEQGGAVLGHAIHNHDLLAAILGPIKRLSAFTTTRVNDIEVEDCAAISFEMTSGALATSSITLGAATDTSRFRFCFEGLTAESDLLPYAPADGTWVFTAREGGRPQSEIDDFLAALPARRSGFVGFFEALADALEAGGREAVTLAEGRRALELVSAIYRSARAGQVVELPLGEGSGMYDGWLP